MTHLPRPPAPVRHTCLATVVAAVAASTTAVVVPAAAQEGATITVDTTSNVVDFGGAQTVADLPGPDGRTSLREATIASTNTAGPERIGFDIPTSDPGFDGSGFVITVDPASAAEQLTLGDDGTTIDATTQPGGYPITVQGSAQARADERRGLVVGSSGNTVISLGFRQYGTAVQVDGGSGNLITGVTVRDNNNGVILGGRGVAGDNVLADSTVTGNARTPVAVTNSLSGTVRGNTISDNALTGVFVLGSPDVTVTGNLITGNHTGIDVHNSPDDTGGSATGNTLVGNTTDGVTISGGRGFTISRNVIADNGELGIDLLGGKENVFGVTRNSKGGPNFPEHLTATDNGTATIVEGRVDYADPQVVTVELFANDAADPSGHGEGQTFLGTATPDAKGRFSAALPTGLVGKFATATATGASGTPRSSPRLSR